MNTRDVYGADSSSYLVEGFTLSVAVTRHVAVIECHRYVSKAVTGV